MLHLFSGTVYVFLDLLWDTGHTSAFLRAYSHTFSGCHCRFLVPHYTYLSGPSLLRLKPSLHLHHGTVASFDTSHAHCWTVATPRFIWVLFSFCYTLLCCIHKGHFVGPFIVPFTVPGTAPTLRYSCYLFVTILGHTCAHTFSFTCACGYRSPFGKFLFPADRHSLHSRYMHFLLSFMVCTWYVHVLYRTRSHAFCIIIVADLVLSRWNLVAFATSSLECTAFRSPAVRGTHPICITPPLSPHLRLTTARTLSSSFVYCDPFLSAAVHLDERRNTFLVATATSGLRVHTAFVFGVYVYVSFLRCAPPPHHAFTFSDFSRWLRSAAGPRDSPWHFWTFSGAHFVAWDSTAFHVARLNALRAVDTQDVHRMVLFGTSPCGGAFWAWMKACGLLRYAILHSPCTLALVACSTQDGDALFTHAVIQAAFLRTFTTFRTFATCVAILFAFISGHFTILDGSGRRCRAADISFRTCTHASFLTTCLQSLWYHSLPARCVLSAAHLVRFMEGHTAPRSTHAFSHVAHTVHTVTVLLLGACRLREFSCAIADNTRYLPDAVTRFIVRYFVPHTHGLLAFSHLFVDVQDILILEERLSGTDLCSHFTHGV